MWGALRKKSRIIFFLGVVVKKKSVLSENSTVLERAFSTIVAAEVLGRQTGVALRGSRREVEVIRETISASRRFDEVLSHPDTDVALIMNALGEKHIAAEAFERLLGVAWPL